jgi:hypothetical protein
LTYANVTFARVHCGEKNQKNYDWKDYLPPGLAYLNVFREKKFKNHYFKRYDLQLHALQFQKLANFNNIDGERKYVFYCWSVIV